LPPKEILYGKTELESPFETNRVYDDYLNSHRENLRTIHEIIKTRIEDEKIKRKKQKYALPKEIPDKVKIVVNKRNIQKIKKPLYQTQKLIDHGTKLGVVRLEDNNKKLRIFKNNTA